MTDLAGRLSEAASAAFEDLGLDPDFGRVVRSNKPELADFQCNGAMAAAKAAKRPPRDIAADLAARLEGDALVGRVDVAGPGFLNLNVTDAALAARAAEIKTDPKAGGGAAPDPETIVLDFGGPNVAKPMHVGHIRSAVIGDTLQRLFRFLGDKVVSDTHLGDWGLQMGLLIVALADERPELPYFDTANEGPFPAEPPVTIEDLGRLYPQASARSKEDEAYKNRAEIAVSEMQAGRAGYRALLRHFIDVSVAALKTDYAFLDVSFDLWKGESDVDHLIPDIVQTYRDKGLAEEDRGELIVRVARENDKKETPPLKLINREGGTGYHATDIATIVDRVEAIGPDRMIYVVDQRQALHFEQVYRAVDLAGIFPEDKLEHIGFGTMNGTDGKPFKTREGGVLRLADLNAMMFEAAAKKIEEAGRLPEDMGADERADVAAKVARAALRFADLQNTRTQNYVFDLDRFMSFEGKTGPYLLYAAVRIKSILRRAGEEGLAAGEITVAHQAERDLVLALDGFATALAQSREKRMPHILCEHVYNLAQAFSVFYTDCPIATADDAGTRASRLALAEAVLKQLETGLGLLGIDAPERM
ncbi:MAG: arginine--tRNA ligase [Pseudomonadota bacterium]